jgi:hypothetical protein
VEDHYPRSSPIWRRRENIAGLCRARVAALTILISLRTCSANGWLWHIGAGRCCTAWGSNRDDSDRCSGTATGGNADTTDLHPLALRCSTWRLQITPELQTHSIPACNPLRRTAKMTT